MASRKSGRETDTEDIKNLDEQMQKLNLDEKRDINILLLGETGVGKSTFINAFCNYLNYPDLKFAMKNKLTTLIPAKFTITDENYEEQIVQVGEDENEYVEAGVSATQASKSYVFPVRRGKLRIRFIDTPGVGDTRGMNQDNMNFENILSFIGEIKHLNAICILLKPNNARLTVMFEFCIKQLLSRLEKSASRNLIFVFTNSRGTFYRPGETMPALKRLLGQVNTVDIPLTKDNIFCTDNEAFRFLAAANHGIKFSSMDIDNFAQSWKKSVAECWRMIQYIAGDNCRQPLEPHQVKNTISINEARRLIVQLSQPLAEIAQLIQDNIYALERHKMGLQLGNDTLADLKGKLYVPVVNLRVTKLDQPTTVCTSVKCSTLYKVGDKNKWHYRQKCHNPCHLRNVPKEIIGSPELVHCAAMNGSSTAMCRICECSYQFHMHIYFETETYEDKLENEAVKSEITSKEFALLTAQNIIKKIERRVQEYNQERDTIIRTTAKFACFLKANAITPYNDAYQSYLEYLIDREKSMGDSADRDIIRQFQQMLREYNEEKNALNSALAQSSYGITKITADDIIECVEQLYKLRHNGLKIQELFTKQKAARKDENRNETREYVHGKQSKKLRKRKNKNKNKETAADTTDSECATDTGHRRPLNAHNPPNQNQRGRQYNNQQRNQGFQPNRYQQNRPNQYQQNRPNQYQQNQANQPNPYQQNQQHGETASNQQSPLQYLQIKQGPSGQFDLRFGQSNQNARRTPEPGYPSGSYQDLHNSNEPQPLMNQNARNPYSNQPPPQPHQRYRKPNPRSHSPNPLNQGNAFNQGPKSFNQGPQQYNQGSQSYNQGPVPQGYNQRSGPQGYNQRPGPQGYNQGPRPQSYNQGPQSYNRGSQSYNQGQHPFNQGSKPYNQEPKHFNQGFKSGNQGTQPFNQGPKWFNNGRPKYYGQHPKHDPPAFKNQQSGRNTPNQSDSGCESTTKKEKSKVYGNTRRHCVDFSSDSSSDSSDEEQYMSCNF